MSCGEDGCNQMATQTTPGRDAAIRSQARGKPFESLAGVAAPTIGPSGRISDRVYEELSEVIRSLELPPGAPISEPAVAAWLNVSRAPVREAFTRLAEQRLVSIVPQVGTQVAPISMRDVEEAVFIRAALEESAFRQATRADHLDTTELDQIVARNLEAADRRDTDEFFDTDEQLHELVFALAGVPRLWQVVRGTKLQLDRLRRLVLSRSIVNREICQEHQMIAQTMRARDEVAGLKVVHRHATRILDDIPALRKLHPDFFTD